MQYINSEGLLIDTIKNESRVCGITNILSGNAVALLGKSNTVGASSLTFMGNNNTVSSNSVLFGGEYNTLSDSFALNGSYNTLSSNSILFNGSHNTVHSGSLVLNGQNDYVTNNSVAVNSVNTNLSSSSISFFDSNNISQNRSLSFYTENSQLTSGLSVYGKNNIVKNSIDIGGENNTVNSDALNVLSDSSVISTSSVNILGQNNNLSQLGVAVLSDNTTSKNSSIAINTFNTSLDNRATGILEDESIIQSNSIGLGGNNNVLRLSSFSVNNFNSRLTDNSFAVFTTNSTISSGSISIGKSNNVNLRANSLGIYNTNSTISSNSVSINNLNSVLRDNSFGMGSNNVSVSSYAIEMLGSNNVVAVSSIDIIGNNNVVLNKGISLIDSNSTTNNSVSLKNTNNSTTTNSVGINGSNNNVSDNSVLITGNLNNVSVSSISLGNFQSVISNSSVVLAGSVINASNSSVGIAGLNNTSSNSSVVLAGSGINASNSSVVLAGSGISASDSSVVLNSTNSIASLSSLIISGNFNTITNNSVGLGGTNVNLQQRKNVAIGGNNVNANAADSVLIGNRNVEASNDVFDLNSPGYDIVSIGGSDNKLGSNSITIGGYNNRAQNSSVIIAGSGNNVGNYKNVAMIAVSDVNAAEDNTAYLPRSFFTGDVTVKGSVSASGNITSIDTLVTTEWVARLVNFLQTSAVMYADQRNNLGNYNVAEFRYLGSPKLFVTQQGVGVNTGSVPAPYVLTINGAASGVNLLLNDKLTLGNGDTNLYRGAANLLKTDDSLNVGTLDTGSTNTVITHSGNTLQQRNINPRTWDTSATFLSGTPTNNYLVKAEGSNKLVNSLVFDNGTNVGVGTQNPFGRLTIWGGGNNANNYNTYNSDISREGLLINAYDLGQPNTWRRVCDIVAGGGDTGSEIRFLTSNYWSHTATAKMIITHDGNVGIGTSPSTKLHVSSTDSFAVTIENPNVATTNAGVADNFTLFKNHYGNTQISNWQNVGMRIGSRTTANGGTGQIVFTTGNDAETMRLTSTGLGIGTTTPAERLTLNGAINTNRLIQFSESDTVRVYVGLGTDNVMRVQTTNTASIRLATNNVDRLFVDGSGNVGIGTMNPGGKLSVYDSTNTDITLQYGSDNLWWITANQSGLLKIGGTGSSRPVSGAINVDYAGRVGISIPSSGARLDVASPVVDEPVLFLRPPSGSYGNRSILGMWSTFGTNSFSDTSIRRTADIVAGYSTSTWGNEYLSFNVGNNGVSNDAAVLTSEKVRITGSGLVLINTTSPTSAYLNNPKLEVRGGSILSRTDSPEGGRLEIINGSKTGSAIANWSVYNMTGVHGNGLHFWRYTADGTNAGTSVFFGDDGKVGIGTNTPEGSLQVAGNTNGMQMASFDSYGASPSGGILVRGAKGTMASPSGVLSGERFGYVVGGSYGTTGFGNSVAMNYIAAQNHSDTARGSYIGFDTTPLNSTTRAERMRIEADGTVKITTGSLYTAGNTGWYNETHGGGWYMSDSSWIRSTNEKSVWMGGGLLGANGGLTVGHGGYAPPIGGALIKGNVGIGESVTNTNPYSYIVGARLHIRENVAGVNARVLLSSDQNVQLMYSTDREGVTGWSFGQDATDSNKFKIANAWNNLATNTRLTIDGAGNVGIGTSTPDRSLQVNGGIRSTSQLILNDGQFWSGLSIQNNNTTDGAASFIDAQNRDGAADSHIFFRHQSDGGSRIEFSTQTPGTFADRRQNRVTINADGYLNASFRGDLVGQVGTSYSVACQVREANYSSNTNTTDAYRPRLGFHWGGVVASSISLRTDGAFSFDDNPGTGRASIYAANVYANLIGSATSLANDRTNWSTYGNISNVVGQLAWKNYGNGHTIFDASNGTAPDGSAISNANPGHTWVGTYPTLMGWNGTATYGVRVDSARVADTVSGSTVCRAWANLSPLSFDNITVSGTFVASGITDLITITVNWSGHSFRVGDVFISTDTGSEINNIYSVTSVPDANNFVCISRWTGSGSGGTGNINLNINFLRMNNGSNGIRSVTMAELTSLNNLSYANRMLDNRIVVNLNSPLYNGHTSYVTFNNCDGLVTAQRFPVPFISSLLRTVNYIYIDIVFNARNLKTSASNRVFYNYGGAMCSVTFDGPTTTSGGVVTQGGDGSVYNLLPGQSVFVPAGAGAGGVYYYGYSDPVAIMYDFKQPRAFPVLNNADFTITSNSTTLPMSPVAGFSIAVFG